MPLWCSIPLSWYQPMLRGHSDVAITKKPRIGGVFRLFVPIGGDCLSAHDIGSLLAFRTLSHIKLDFLTFFKGLEAVHLNCGKVGEQIFTAIQMSDKSEAFGIVEPLDGTCCHKSVFQIMTDHTSRISKKPRVTLPPPKPCSLHIDNCITSALSMILIVPAKNIKVKAVCSWSLTYCKEFA